jgi:hypothetical protein
MSYVILRGRWCDIIVHWEDQDVGGWTILKWILEREDGMGDWINLAQDRDQWRALVNAVMNLRVS